MLKATVCCLAAIVLMGCGSPEAAIELRSPSGPISDEEFARHLDAAHGPKEFFTLDDLKFADPLHADLARRFDAAARKLAGQEWVHEGYNGRRDSRSIAATWSNVAGPKQQGVEQHGIKIDVQRIADDPRTILAVGVTANWAPADSGWGASVCYFGPHDRVWEEGKRFRILFRYYPRGEFQWQTPKLDIFDDLASIRVTKRFDTTEYHVGVSTQPTTDTVPLEQALSWLESPERMCDLALARLDELKRQAEADVLSGQAIGEGHIISRASMPRPSASLAIALANGPQAIPPPRSGRVMTEDERRESLGDMLDLIEQRRELVRENYREMFAALEKAFPLITCLDKDIDFLDAEPGRLNSINLRIRHELNDTPFDPRHDPANDARDALYYGLSDFQAELEKQTDPGEFSSVGQVYNLFLVEGDMDAWDRREMDVPLTQSQVRTVNLFVPPRELDRLNELPNLEAVLLESHSTYREDGKFTNVTGWRKDPDQLARLLRLDAMTRVLFLHLPIGRVTNDNTLDDVARLEQLRGLCLWNSDVSDVGMKKLQSLIHLQCLNLDGTLVGDNGVNHLAGLPELRSVSLNGTKVTNASIDSFARFPKLMELRVWGTAIDEEGVKKLKSLAAGIKYIQFGTEGLHPWWGHHEPLYQHESANGESGAR